MRQENETWIDVPGYEGLYEISNLGRLWSIKRATELKPNVHPTGYINVGLRSEGKRSYFRLGRLVALAFIGACPEGCEVNHKNGNKTDNTVENLEWVTHSKNLKHAYATGLRKPTLPHHMGSEIRSAKLTETDVRLIRKLTKQGQSQRQIAKQFGVNKSAIADINNGITWMHVKSG